MSGLHRRDQWMNSVCDNWKLVRSAHESHAGFNRSIIGIYGKTHAFFMVYHVVLSMWYPYFLCSPHPHVHV